MRGSGPTGKVPQRSSAKGRVKRAARDRKKRKTRSERMGRGRAYNPRVLLLRAAALVTAACLTLHCAKGPPPPTGAAAAFDLPDLAGGTVSLASLKGQVVVLDF